MRRLAAFGVLLSMRSAAKRSQNRSSPRRSRFQVCFSARPRRALPPVNPPGLTPRKKLLLTGDAPNLVPTQTPGQLANLWDSRVSGKPAHILVFRGLGCVMWDTDRHAPIPLLFFFIFLSGLRAKVYLPLLGLMGLVIGFSSSCSGLKCSAPPVPAAAPAGWPSTGAEPAPPETPLSSGRPKARPCALLWKLPAPYRQRLLLMFGRHDVSLSLS